MDAALIDPALIVKQKKMGLGIGCRLCSNQDPEHAKSGVFTMLDVNPYCVGCEQLYCQAHTSPRNIYFCQNCLP